MQRWEYKVAYLVECPDAENLLNNLGKEGWELAAIEGTGAYFKRPIIEDTPVLAFSTDSPKQLMRVG